jgi:Ca2+-binding EF-hand superfamily protein
MKKSTIIIAGLFTIATIMTSCKSSSEATKEKTERSGKKRGGERPNLETIFSQMDVNKDGKISKSEAKGPLSQDFSTIDTNEDGFISKEELKNAPKPNRQQRPRN